MESELPGLPSPRRIASAVPPPMPLLGGTVTKLKSTTKMKFTATLTGDRRFWGSRRTRRPGNLGRVSHAAGASETTKIDDLRMLAYTWVFITRLLCQLEIGAPKDGSSEVGRKSPTGSTLGHVSGRES